MTHGGVKTGNFTGSPTMLINQPQDYVGVPEKTKRSQRSACLAEAYVMGKLYKEKLQKDITAQKITTTGDGQREVMNNPCDQMRTTDSDHNHGCFFGMFKKIHPNPNASSPDSVR
ncbi:hypothetical protein RHSIM_RhsimUnG0073500 [Rhododendron simsii]|uniref:Uncharacterized protein n=1 Tax=Rhododendron simsii TaxID=118357 RepID=A0A834G244_RHOSS|nr:hypothetical protein RHSIM_RhsimUnG0073500 [Rhododendron simsii]